MAKKKGGGKSFLSRAIRDIVSGTLVGVICGFLVWTIAQTDFFKKFEYMWLDWMIVNREPVSQMPEVGYVNFDNPSINLAGQWPWQRNFHVRLVTTLRDFGVRAAGYDVFFTEPSNIVANKPSEKDLESAIKNQGFDKPLFHDFDLEFEEALKESGIIFLGQFFEMPNIGEATSKETVREAIKKRREDTWNELKKNNFEAVRGSSFETNEEFEEHMNKMVDLTPPLARFTAVSAGVGFAQIVKELTPTVHHYPLFLDYNKRIYPSITMIMLKDVLGLNFEKLRVVDEKYIEIPVEKTYRDFEPGVIRIPAEPRNNYRMFANWTGALEDSFFHISYVQLSYYYGYNDLKRRVTQNPPTYEHAQERLESYIEHLKKERIVFPDQARPLAEDVLLAWLAYSNPDDTERDFLRKTKNIAVAEDARRIFQGTRLGMSVAASATQEKIDRVLKEAPTLAEVDPFEYAREESMSALTREHREEITRCTLFMLGENKKDLNPPYFPPPQSTLYNGKTVPLSPTMLKDKILMIGLVGDGTMDLNPQPFQESCAMVALHANAINTVLSREFMSFSPRWLTIALTFGAAVFIGAVGYLVSISISLPLFIALLLGALYASFRTLEQHSVWIQIVAPVTAHTLTYITAVGVQLYQAYREKQKVKKLFGTMVSDDVLKLMQENPDSFSLRGRRQACTSFFSSLEGFHSITKGVTPQEQIGLLSRYLTPTSQIIMSYGGYIDKYESHIIMADYGVPLEDPTHTLKCLYSSLEQQVDIQPFKAFIHARYGKKVSVSMGINAGYVSAGNMGSDKKMQYTIMGDTVNTAARFRPANWIYNYLGSPIIGEGTYALARNHIQTRMLDKLLLKGKVKPVTIYQVVGWIPEHYISLRNTTDLGDTLSVMWGRAAPEKIYGYALYWRQQHKRSAVGLADEIASFFESEIASAGRQLEFELKAQVIDNWQRCLALVDDCKKLEVGEITHPSGEHWEERLEHWSKQVEAVLKSVQSLGDDPDAQRLGRELTVIIEKIEAVVERLKTDVPLPDELSHAWDTLRKMLNGDFTNDTTNYPAAFDNEYRGYQERATRFAEKVTARKDEYIALLALAGSMTDEQRTGCRLYEEAMELQWNREWDAAIEKFNAVLEVMPDDPATLALLERMEIYKANPPGESWQGEFVQTKK